MLLNEAYEKDFTVKLKDRLAAEVLLATETFNKFKHENRDYLNHPNHAAILSRLLHCGIETGLYNLAFSPQDYFQCMQRSVNTFGHMINEMRTDNFVFTSAKTNKSGQLPAKSSYKEAYAKENSGAGGQLYFDFSVEEVPNIVMPPYYAVLTYGYNKDNSECSHITIVVPDQNFKYSLLTDKLETRQSVIDIIPKQEREETIVSLNEQFENLVKLREIK